MIKSEILVTYRYMWKVAGNDSVCVKIVTDIPSGHEGVVAAILAIEGLESAAREYLHEFDVARIGQVVSLKEKNEKSEVKNNEAL